MNKQANQKLLVIVGETGSGKSALALEIAQRFNGEIICADSRTVYKGMDIGTAKPSLVEQQQVPHHLLDVVSPDEPYNAARFKADAEMVIKDILERGKLPLLVGGTGLYVDAVLYDYQFSLAPDSAERARYQAMSVEALQQEIRHKGLALPSNERNPRHLQRVLETNGQIAVKSELRPETLVIGLAVERTVLKRRLAARAEEMFANGLLTEAERLFTSYGPDAEALQAPAYKALYAYEQGLLSLDEAKQRFIQNDLKLAKRQRTWFKRNNSIHWLNDPSKYVELVTTFLSHSA